MPASTSPQDLIAHTRGKTEFIDRVTDRAMRHFQARACILTLDEAWKAAAARRDLDGMLAIGNPGNGQGYNPETV